MHPAEEPEPQRPREIAVSPAASSSRPGAGPASPGDLVGGRGWLPAWEQTPKPAFSLPLREGLPHLSPSPLLPPKAAWENSCLPLHTGVGPRRRGGQRSHHRRSLSQAFRARALAGEEKEGDAERALETASPKGMNPGHLQHQLRDSGQRRWGAPRGAAPNPARLQVDPTGTPWCPTGGSEAPHGVAFRILPREPKYLPRSFKPEDFKNI